MWNFVNYVKMRHSMQKRRICMDNYFCGWYIKCQDAFRTVAFIPAYHITGGVKTCSLQVITNEGAWYIDYPIGQFRMDENSVTIGPNTFSKQGCKLDIHTPELTVTGELTFGPFTPLAYDIMGPFKYVPFMQCRHSVFSMKHRVRGELRINGESWKLTVGECYIEGDRGRSFPREYLWTQCCNPWGSIMLSVADIPFCGLHFTGVICAITYQGRKYRLATYLGARAVSIQNGEIIIRQGRKTLTVRRLEDRGKPLAAPVGGDMKRIIRESPQCRVFYHYQEKGQTVFRFSSEVASFEYEYPQ